MKLIFGLIFFIIFTQSCYGDEYKYILNDNCINRLYIEANSDICDLHIEKDSRGVLIRFEINEPDKEFVELSAFTKNNINKVRYFLAKIKNPVIIEVHTKKAEEISHERVKNWEISTVIANKIEQYLANSNPKLDYKRISSVGYGEFLPAKNTPYNGGKLNNRVDIIILCNITGE